MLQGSRIYWDIFNLTGRKYANRQKKRPGHVLQRSPEAAHRAKAYDGGYLERDQGHPVSGV